MPQSTFAFALEPRMPRPIPALSGRHAEYRRAFVRSGMGGLIHCGRLATGAGDCERCAEFQAAPGAPERSAAKTTDTSSRCPTLPETYFGIPPDYHNATPR